MSVYEQNDVYIELRMTKTYPLPPRHTQGPPSLHRNHPQIDRRSNLQQKDCWSHCWNLHSN